MKKSLAIIALSGTLLLSSGCAAIFPDIKIHRAEQNKRIYIGMSFDEVVKIVGREPYLGETIKQTNALGEWLTWVIDPGLSWSRVYTFTFRNGYLESWTSFE